MSVVGTFNGWNVVSLPNSQLRSVDFTDHEIVAQSSSPWTGQSQTYDWGQSFLSAMVTTAKLTRAQGAAWTAALRACRGPLNVFQFGDPGMLGPLGAAGVNLAPDPFFQMPLGLLWSQPDPNWYISPGRNPSKSNYLKVSSTDSGVSSSSTAVPVAVVAGQKYTLSGCMDASAATSGVLAIAAANASFSIDYGIVVAAAGTSGQFTVSFIVPGGVTVVYLRCELSAAVWAAGKTVSFSNISLTAGAPVVNGAGQSGYSLATSGWPASVANLLLPGDYLSIASAPVNGGDISPLRLYSATQAVSSDASGNATIPIWPPLRESPASAAPLQLTNTQGLFRRSDVKQQWNENYDKTVSLSFGIVEAL
jgi:hypothetical protein